MLTCGYINTTGGFSHPLYLTFDFFPLSLGSTTTWNQLCPIKAGKSNWFSSIRWFLCYITRRFLIIITFFSKLLRRQHFWTHCSNFCLIQEKSFRADKLMEFYKVSSYIRVFIVSLCTKLGHVSGWKLLFFKFYA